MVIDTDDGGLRYAVAVDVTEDESLLRFGLKWIDAGTEAVSWQAGDGAHETYYVHEGALRIQWSGTEQGQVTVSAGECFYLAPGRSYTIENVGPNDVFVIWAATDQDGATT